MGTFRTKGHTGVDMQSFYPGPGRVASCILLDAGRGTVCVSVIDRDPGQSQPGDKEVYEQEARVRGCKGTGVVTILQTDRGDCFLILTRGQGGISCIDRGIKGCFSH